MLLHFFLVLRNNGISVSLREYLDLLEGLKSEVVPPGLDSLYYLSRTVLVKREQQFHLFDRLFGEVFGRLQSAANDAVGDIPEEFLKKNSVRQLTTEEIAQIKAFGGFKELKTRFEELLKEQKERHKGGKTWIGTGGTSPFGAWGYNPAGIRAGQNESRHRKATKVWEERNFEDLDDTIELNTRQFKLALRRLRMLSRYGNIPEFNLKETVTRSSRNGGYLELAYSAPKTNQVKMLLLLDVGGSMDDHVSLCEQLFTASRHEYKHLEHFYFHNCLYEKLWKSNKRSRSQSLATEELFNTYSRDYKLIIVGDASMSPYELLDAGGSVEHINEEPGKVWLERVRNYFPQNIWLNPVPEEEWDFIESIGMIRKTFEDRMFPLTLAGLEKGIKLLKS